MKQRVVRILAFMLPLFQLSILTQAQDVRLVEPFDVLRYTMKVPPAQKQDMLKKIAGGALPVNDVSSKEMVSDHDRILLMDEVGSLAYDVTNSTKGEVEYEISTNLPEIWSAVFRRQALVNDYFSAKRNNERIDFFGDALPRLASTNSTWTIKLKPKETVRLYLEFTAKDGLNQGNLVVKFRNKKNNKLFEIKTPVFVSEKNVPSTAFNSIVFNSDTYEIASYYGELEKAGFTHQISYTYPTAQFNERGDMVGEPNFGSADGKQFRYVTNAWMKRGHPILLYWTPRFSKLARVSASDQYLTPYSEPWINAYINLVRSSFKDIKSRVPNTNYDDVILYIHDEITSGSYSDKTSEQVNNVSRLLKEIKRQIPEFKTLLTFSMYTFPADFKAVAQYTDIAVPLILLPEKLEKRAPASYNPVKSFEDNLYKSGREINRSRIVALKSESVNASAKTSTEPIFWSYLVSQGKTSNILDFRALPLYAKLLGREGFSLWAFADTRGSSWLPTDGGDKVDYSMYYLKEPNNAIYKYYVMDESERMIPSIRLFALRAGAQDAKILGYLIQNRNSFSSTQRKKFDTIIGQLEGTLNSIGNQPERSRFLSLSQYEDISQELRKLYIEL